MRKGCIIFVLALIPCFLNAQYQIIPEDVSNEAIYEFLDEMAGENLIQINSAVKPYSRNFISEKLSELSAKDSLLNKRQQQSLAFFMKGYALERNELPTERYVNLINKESESVSLAVFPPAFYYKDTLFRVRINPILGVNVQSNENGTLYQRFWGGEFQSMIGKYLAVYASLRDNHLDKQVLANPEYLTDAQGGAYKWADDLSSADYSEMRGGITLGNKWVNIGLEKKYVQWGENYHGANILSGRSPSFPMISFNLKPARWIELNYIHGFLTSNVLDSADYYLGEDNEKRFRYRNKYIAANMFTITPINGLNIAFGNSIIYAEKTVKAGYLIPCMFFKSIDHSSTMGSENQNSQMYFSISSRNIKHLHIYTTFFIDEFKASRIKDTTHNFVSYKAGLNLSNWPIKNVSLTGEFTFTNPITYKHRVQNTTYASSDYNLGHYLGDNAMETYFALTYRPFSTFQAKLSYTNARKGNDYAYMDGVSAIQTPNMKDIVWENNTVALECRYLFLTALQASFSVSYSDIKTKDAQSFSAHGFVLEEDTSADEYMNRFTPAFYQGKTLTFSVGLNYYF